MKDFGRWLAEYELPGEVASEEETLPEGVWETFAGTFMARCCRCDRETEILCDLELIPKHGYVHYCYGSPYCCP